MATPESTLGDLAAFMTSKNAGPFLVTLDVVFHSSDEFEYVRDLGIVSAERVASLYQLDIDSVVGIHHFAPANAIKVTLKRRVPSGFIGDTDIYGAQQHVPLMNLPLPPSVTSITSKDEEE